MTEQCAVRERVAEELGRVVAAEGAAISTMPRMFGVLMRRACPDADTEIDALEQVLSAGIVAAMRDEDGRDTVPALADRLVQTTEMPEGLARWAIETWWRALRPLDTAGGPKDWAAWNRLDLPGQTAGFGGSHRRSILQLTVVALAGALGGAAWGFRVLVHGEEALIGPAVKALAELDGWVRTFALLALGGLGGFAGGLLGWIGGGARNSTCEDHGGTTLGRLGLSALGAFAGALVGGLAGLVVLGPAGMMLGALFCGALGAFLGLLLAERLSLWWR
jgi:hypothetical protein